MTPFFFFRWRPDGPPLIKITTLEFFPNYFFFLQRQKLLKDHNPTCCRNASGPVLSLNHVLGQFYIFLTPPGIYSSNLKDLIEFFFRNNFISATQNNSKINEIFKNNLLVRRFHQVNTPVQSKPHSLKKCQCPSLVQQQLKTGWACGNS